MFLFALEKVLKLLSYVLYLVALDNPDMDIRRNVGRTFNNKQAVARLLVDSYDINATSKCQKVCTVKPLVCGSWFHLSFENFDVITGYARKLYGQYNGKQTSF